MYSVSFFTHNKNIRKENPVRADYRIARRASDFDRGKDKDGTNSGSVLAYSLYGLLFEKWYLMSFQYLGIIEQPIRCTRTGCRACSRRR